MELSERIAAWREHVGLSRKQVADACGVVAGAVYQWEKGLKKEDEPKKRIKPSVGHLERMVKRFGITMEQFYGPVPRRRRAS